MPHLVSVVGVNHHASLMLLLMMTPAPVITDVSHHVQTPHCSSISTESSAHSPLFSDTPSHQPSRSSVSRSAVASLSSIMELFLAGHHTNAKQRSPVLLLTSPPGTCAESLCYVGDYIRAESAFFFLESQGIFSVLGCLLT